jgi:hypothetical protein
MTWTAWYLVNTAPGSADMRELLELMEQRLEEMKQH